MTVSDVDVAIIGGGPAGLACALEAGKHGMSCIVVEKGGITDAIRRFPAMMTFFSTPELLELDEIPFTTTNFRPTRAEVLRYYAKVAEYRRVNMMLYTTAERAVRQPDGRFRLITSKGEITAKAVIIATGYFDQPNMLNVAGEDLPHVTHYYVEPYGYTGTKVAVVGGRNSAAETALELYRHGADVTLIHRGDSPGKSVKYWVKPDLENRLKNGEIRAMFNTVIEEIRPENLLIRNTGTNERAEIAADFVVLHTGYRPDVTLLERCGVEYDKRTLIPEINAETYETSMAGIYVAGSVMCGCESYNIFIENGRLHARPIIESIAAKYL